MDYIALEGIAPYDGRYEFDIGERELTTREWGWIKRLSGYLPLTIEQGFVGADPELIAVFAAIALRRAGKIEARELPQVFEQLADAPFGATIRLEAGVEQEAESSPPESSSNGSTATSGDDSSTSSEIPAPTPSATGTPDSAISASARTMSES